MIATQPTTLVTGIGELTTNDATREGLLGLVADAAVVIEGGRIAWVGESSDAPPPTPRSTSVAARSSPALSTATATWSSPGTARPSSPRG